MTMEGLYTVQFADYYRKQLQPQIRRFKGPAATWESALTGESA
jgi:hypothetical protein